MKLFKTVMMLTCLTAAAVSQAGLYEFKANPTFGGDVVGAVEEINSTYNSSTEQFTWDVDFTSAMTGVDGFWLVVNAGGNPKDSDVNELAIIYGDLQTGIASTYVYNGANNSNSINNPGILLQTDTFTATSTGFNLNIATGAINSWVSPDPDYTGISYDTGIGVWFHVATGSNFTYLNDDIVDFSFASQGWFDISDGTATEVSSPSAFALLGLSLLGMSLYRRKS